MCLLGANPFECSNILGFADDLGFKSLVVLDLLFLGITNDVALSPSLSSPVCLQTHGTAQPNKLC